MSQKRVAAIHDISCFGKCSITVALPIISAVGVETAVIPTAVLSTHTGGFKGYTFRDLTEDILPIVKHWKKENISVDAVYTGYLGSKEQISIVTKAIQKIKRENSLIIVDPVMADNGKLYGGFSEDFPREMRKLCRVADVITPNITEAAFLLGMPYQEAPYTKEYIESMIYALGTLTGASVILTGVCFDDRRLGAACLENGKITYAFSEKIDAMYHGTGDVFSSTVVGALMNGRSLKASMEIAVNFTCGCIRKTLNEHPERRYGVDFETEIPNLLKYLEL